MLREIMVINPSKKKRTRKKKTKTAAPKKEAATMARKKSSRKRRRNPATVTTTPRTTRRRRTYRRKHNPEGGSRRSLFSGLSITQALKTSIPLLLGMFSAKFGARRLVWQGAGTETDPESWTWDVYPKAAAAGGLAAIAARFIAPRHAQNILNGALSYVAFKAIENEIIAKNDTATKWLGADDYQPDEYMGELPGDTYEADQSYYLGEDGNYYAADDSDRIPEEIGEALLPPGDLGAESLEPVGPLGADPYVKSWIGRA